MSLSKQHRRNHSKWNQFAMECDDQNRWEAHRWCCQHLRGEWSFARNTYDRFYIKRDFDAMLFKLAWADATHTRAKR